MGAAAEPSCVTQCWSRLFGEIRLVLETELKNILENKAIKYHAQGVVLCCSEM